jgi:hypothetical protein
MLDLHTSSPYSPDSSKVKFHYTPWYYEIKARIQWIPQRIREIFENYRVPWEPAIDEYVTRLQDMESLLESEKVEMYILRRIEVIQDCLNHLLKANTIPVKAVRISHNNQIAIEFHDRTMAIMNADFAIRSTRKRIRRVTEEDQESTLDLHPHDPYEPDE